MFGKILTVLFVCYVGPTLVDSTWHVTRVRKLQTSITQPPMKKNQVRKLELSPLLRISSSYVLPLFSRKGRVAPKHITMFLLDLESWSIVEQIDFIYRATRITINFCSRSYGRVTTAH